MSLNVYTAYKLKRDADLWPVCEAAHAFATQVVKDVLCDAYINAANKVAVTDPEFVKKLAVSEQYNGPMTQAAEDQIRLDMARSVVRAKYAIAATSSFREEFNFDVSIGAWRFGKSWYLRPFCDLNVRRALDCLDADKRVVPYGYWDSTDRDEGISASEWRRRETVWRGINAQYHRAGNPHLSVDIMSFSRYNSMCVDPFFDLRREVLATGLAAVTEAGPRSALAREDIGLPPLPRPEAVTNPEITGRKVGSKASPAKVVTKRTKGIVAAQNAAAGKPIKPAKTRPKTTWKKKPGKPAPEKRVENA